jgi:hypothetical protein
MATRSMTHALALAHRAQASRARQRQKVRQFEHAVFRKSGLAVGAVLIGVGQRNGVPVDVAGVPWKPVFALAAMLTEAFSSSPVVSQIAGGLGDAAMATYVKDAVANGTLIAGELP